MLLKGNGKIQKSIFFNLLILDITPYVDSIESHYMLLTKIPLVFSLVFIQTMSI